MEHKKGTEAEIIASVHLLDKTFDQQHHATHQRFIKLLVRIIASIPALLGRGGHGDAGIILKETCNAEFSRIPFTTPSHPNVNTINSSNYANV